MFNGFTLPDESSSCTIALPANWPEVSKAIDNLAELKVVQLVLWTTWGNGQADALVPLSIDDIVEVTGMCSRSVTSGIKRAIEHGYIECQEDDNLCFYGLKLAQIDEQTLFDDTSFVSTTEQALSDTNFVFLPESALEADPAIDTTFVSSSNEFERDINNNNSGNVIRIQEPQDLSLLTRADNATLCHKLESLSVDLGDGAHIASNIGQAKSILAQYIANGGNFEAFLLLLLEAKTLAHRRTNIRRPNKMPYFFACLRTACSSGKPPAELQEAS